MRERGGLQKNKYNNYRGMHPHSRANLSKPGEQKGGGSHSVSLVILLREKLAEIPPKGLDDEINKEGKTNARLIVDRIVREAIDGNVGLIREILDRTVGRPVQAISGPEGSPIQIQQSLRLSPIEISMALETLILHGAIAIEGQSYPRLKEGSGDGEEASG